MSIINVAVIPLIYFIWKEFKDASAPVQVFNAVPSPFFSAAP